MIRKLAIHAALLCAVIVQAISGQAANGSITIENVAEIKYPTAQQWSPDGKAVAFLWDAAGKQDLFVVRPGEKPVALTDFPVDADMLQSDIGSFEWASPTRILFAYNGALWSVSTDGSKPERLPGFAGVSSFSLSPDLSQIAFIRKGQVWVASLAAKTERQLTQLPEGLTAGAPGFSPDATYVAFYASRGADEPIPMPYNGNRMQVFRVNRWDTQLGLVSVYGGDPVLVPTSGGGNRAQSGTHQWATGNALVRQELSSDRKTREIKITSTDGTTRTLWKDYDPAWWSPSGGTSTVSSPDGKWVAFVCDRSGWPHLYVIPSDATSESQAKQISTGNFGVTYPAWSADSKYLAFSHSADGNQMERFLSVAELPSGKVTPVVKARGVNINPSFSPDGKMLIYSRAAVEHPLEVYAASVNSGNPIRLTDSLPPSLQPQDLTAPVPVQFPSRASDHKSVPGTLMVHKNLDRSKKHPAIVWIHGSGADQNYLGWHPGAYRMYYSIHQYFAQQGYVILTPDYRGSSGYHRDWATGHYMDLGGGETQDVAAGADYLKTLPYVDPDRIGVWGLSYGGFMTLQAVTTTPTLFRCAINVAGVADWATHGPWSIGRMGTPVSNPDGYYRSAPVKHLSKLEVPLLILHGTNDTNVPIIQTLDVVDQLQKLGKPHEIALYPGEIHFFRRAHVLRDAWRRSEAFFNQYLKDTSITTSSSQTNTIANQ
ncbi:MAG: prolyl oligopeptidase family serine peptidase [Candidatus Korobacteraceae bacterium]